MKGEVSSVSHAAVPPRNGEAACAGQLVCICTIMIIPGMHLAWHAFLPPMLCSFVRAPTMSTYQNITGVSPPKSRRGAVFAELAERLCSELGVPSAEVRRHIVKFTLRVPGGTMVPFDVGVAQNLVRSLCALLPYPNSDGAGQQALSAWLHISCPAALASPCFWRHMHGSNCMGPT